MSRVITCLNEKGGVGKSQITFSLAWELSNQGNKVLMIDMDGQRANLTFMSGVEKDDDMLTMYDILQKNKSPYNAIKEIKENLDIIPANDELSDISQKATLSRANELIKDLKKHYDYIFVDVNPDPDWRHFLTLGGMCDYAIVVMLPDVMCLEANSGVLETLKYVKDANSNLKVLGILYNKFETRTNLSKQVQEITKQFADAMNTKVFNTTIRSAVSMAESVGAHMGITSYDSNSAVANDIRNLIEEFKERY